MRHMSSDPAYPVVVIEEVLYCRIKVIYDNHQSFVI